LINAASARAEGEASRCRFSTTLRRSASVRCCDRKRLPLSAPISISKPPSRRAASATNSGEASASDHA
jgi:hypothetical protein